MRLGNLQVHKASKVFKCAQCKEEIFAKESYFSFVYPRTTKGYWARRLHWQCLIPYTNDKWAESLAKPNLKGGRPRLKLDSPIKHRRRVLLSYLNHRDVQNFIKGVEEQKISRARSALANMLKRVEELNEITEGIPYPTPFGNENFSRALHSYNEELITKIRNTTSLKEKFEVLRSSL